MDEVDEVTPPMQRKRRVPSPMCPLRFGEPCNLCVPGADGPHNCPTVQLVMEDEELRAELLRRNRIARELSREKRLNEK